MGERTAVDIAASVRTALEAADLDAFADLLDPRVTWGAPGDPSPPCQNRQQVLEWYRQGRADGRRARVTDAFAHQDKVLVAMRVTPGDGRPEADEADRWQVLTVAHGRVTDIRGYDNERAARAATGLVP
jgi:ketosteroid isomerase-like protein